MFAGIDIGSRSIELVCRENGQTVLARKLPTTFDPLTQIKRIMDGVQPRAMTATGYGRDLAAQSLGDSLPITTITEIKAYGLGAAQVAPTARTVLDIGGQDTKAILLGQGGKVLKFEMNDRCAAGTGKFLEHVANVFQIPMDEFGPYALQGENALAINSMCTVFAETEATSLMAQGHAPHDIALGLHASIAKRTANMLRRVGLTSPLLFVGGVANNPCMIKLVADALGEPPLVPDEPDLVGALGAALHAQAAEGL